MPQVENSTHGEVSENSRSSDFLMCLGLYGEGMHGKSILKFLFKDQN